MDDRYAEGGEEQSLPGPLHTLDGNVAILEAVEGSLHVNVNTCTF